MSLIFKAAADYYKVIRAEYETFRENSYRRAETECNGVLLNRVGKAAGIDAYSLFMGNHARAYKYASAELVEHWGKYPRVTWTDYERQVFDRGADYGEV